MRTDLEHPGSPFDGVGPQPVRCRWLSDEDAARAAAADMIRLLVDDSRGDTHWPNDVYQQNALREVAAFVGPNRAALATPAGMVTAAFPRPDYTPASLAASVEAVQEAVAGLAPVPPGVEVLLGVDGCVPGEATPLQSVLHLGGPSPGQATVKLYPASGERGTLLGWTLCRAEGGIPIELAAGRRAATRAGVVLVLACHEAAIFSGRSRAVLKDELGLLLRRYFLEQVRLEPAARYAFWPRTGWGPARGRRSGTRPATWRRRSG
jgi:hypothetical protein